MMSDEVHFHLTSAVNKQNWPYWTLYGHNPYIIYEKKLHNLCGRGWGAGVAVWGIVRRVEYDRD